MKPSYASLPETDVERSPIPSAFICAITRSVLSLIKPCACIITALSEIMSDPVVTCDGQSYERTAIEVTE